MPQEVDSAVALATAAAELTGAAGHVDPNSPRVNKRSLLHERMEAKWRRVAQKRTLTSS